MKLIDKDALVAEIKRRLDKLANTSTENNREFEAIIGAQHYELISLVQYINTLEVKEVGEPTDVFIDKACEWLRTHSEADYFEIIPDFNYCGAGNLNKKRMIEDFKNYMKGE